MTHTEKLLALALTVLMVYVPASAMAYSILIDESHYQMQPLGSDVRFSQARAALIADGHTLSLLTAPQGITPAALAGYDVFYTGTLQVPLGSSEIEALHDFVSTGGGVIVGHNGGGNAATATASVNSFLTPYGVEMQGWLIGISGLEITGFVDHCLTEGIERIGVDWARPIASVTPPAQNMTSGTVDILSVTEVGSGWVIVFGDHSCWSDPGTGSDFDIQDFDNLTLLLNTFGYEICPPISVERVSWGTAKAAYR